MNELVSLRSAIVRVPYVLSALTSALLLSACAPQATRAVAASPTAVASLPSAAAADPAVAGITDTALPLETRVGFLVNFARRGELDLLSLALDAGLPIDAADTLDQTPLLAAVSQNRLDAVQLLLSRKADPDKVDKAGWSPLHYATYFGSANDIIDALLAAHADINARNDRGITALYFAASTGHESQVEHLLARGADRSIASNAGFTPLRVAQLRGIASIAQRLEAPAAQAAQAADARPAAAASR